MMSDLLALYGTTEPPARPRRLKAGPLEVDLVDGNLRTIRFADREVIRAIAYVVRDRDWGTYDLGVDDPTVSEDENGFHVSWSAVCTAPDGAKLSLWATIRGEASGRLAFEVTVSPDRDFETNRCGFCILHPIEGIAGRPVAVTRSDGSVEASVFPDLIEPWQPFKDIAAIRHEPSPGVSVALRMDGNVFEMEDQRAWSDASYKTYVRPLALPWPYRLRSGETNTQCVAVEIEGTAVSPTVSKRAEDAVTLSLDEARDERFPSFGLLVSPEDTSDILAAPNRLRELAPCHLLYHLDPSAGHGEAELRALADVQAVLPETYAMLECVVPCERALDLELAETAKLIAAAGLRLDAITVGPSVDRRSTPPGSEWPPCPPLTDVYAAARRAFPRLPLGGGMFSYFTELNRKRPPVDDLDYVTHATCPIVHAADDLSVMQSLEAIPFITQSTRAVIGGGKPYHLGPTTIGMRQNPYGSRTMPNPANRRVAMAADDPRQRGLFAAAWLVGYAARLRGAGVRRWTGGSVAGPRGLFDEAGHPRPAFPVAVGLAALDGLRSRNLLSSDRSAVDGIAATGSDGSVRLWIANLSAGLRNVRLPASPSGWRRGPDDVSTSEDDVSGVLDRIELGPYAVVRLDSAASTPAAA